MSQTKTCVICNITKPKEEFRRWKSTALRRSCSTCKASREVTSAIYMRYRAYGLTDVEYRTLLVAQEGKCAICKEVPKRRIHIDHCHTTKKVRGLLCGPCNFGLGHFRDDPKLLDSAKEYLGQSSLDT